MYFNSLFLIIKITRQLHRSVLAIYTRQPEGKSNNQNVHRIHGHV